VLRNVLLSEQTVAIRKRKFLNTYSAINNALCNAKKELALR